MIGVVDSGPSDLPRGDDKDTGNGEADAGENGEGGALARASESTENADNYHEPADAGNRAGDASRGAIVRVVFRPCGA